MFEWWHTILAGHKVNINKLVINSWYAIYSDNGLVLYRLVLFFFFIVIDI